MADPHPPASKAGDKPRKPEEFDAQLDQLLQQIEEKEPDMMSHATPLAKEEAVSDQARVDPETAPAPESEPDVASAPQDQAQDALLAIEDAKAAAAQANPDNPSVSEDVAEAAMLAAMGLAPDGSPLEEQTPVEDAQPDVAAAVADDLIDDQIEAAIQAVPAAPDAAPQPSAEPDEGDLSATLDQLIDQVGEAAPAVEPEIAPEALATEAQASQPEAGPTSEDPLTNQLDQLLQADTPVETEPGIEGTFDAPDPQLIAEAAAANQGVVPPEADPQAGMEASPETQASSAELASTDVAPPASSDQGPSAETISLDELDEMIAETADDAVGGTFETVSEVVHGQAEADVPAGSTAEESTAAIEAAAQSAAVSQAEDDQALAGDFASPEDLLDSASAGADDTLASAQDVARELDEQPEVAAAAAASGEPVIARPSIFARVRAGLAKLVIFEPMARKACALVNLPVSRLSPELRDTLGWVAIAFAAPGFLFFLYSLLS